MIIEYSRIHLVFQTSISRLETKSDLVLALKNAHDPRRFGLLLPIREWLSGLNEENLLSLLGKIKISFSSLSFVCS